jgi:hypothetical protein
MSTDTISDQTEARRYIIELREGQCFSRVRYLVPEGDRSDDWQEAPCKRGDECWVVVSADDLDAEDASVGQEFIEIIEIVETRTRGQLALYRQWIIDPNGDEVMSRSWVPRRSQLRKQFVSTLKGTLNHGDYRECGRSRRSRRVRGPTKDRDG